ncbi:MAG: cyclic nucleotide-binding domain-containing protein [Bacteroidetes bacterium]|nr:cyclic nucleotide-binding domain-containing protein [Bacteroidota bacterium]
MGIQQKRKIYNEGEVLSKEGELSFEWFVLLNGKIGIFKGEKLVNSINQRGMIFGELSGILARPRTATMKALETTEVMCIESSIDEVIRNHPDIANKILVNLAERLAQTTDDLWTVIQENE